MDCYSCQAQAGLRQISPGPTIYEGRYWLVEHAYPCRLAGWLVLVLKRHAEAVHELTPAECAELGELQGRTARTLAAVLDCEKEYVLGLAEAPHFHHVHVHVVAKPRDLPAQFVGTKIFDLLKTDDAVPVPPATITRLCEELRAAFLP
jgi:diadenosine tetraphosphate (Ap4A) HIT family hydrolase